jgi:hypothetical protein
VLANGRSALDSTDAGLTVVVLADSYWQHVVSYYVKNGIPRAEQACIRAALNPLLRMYSKEPAGKIGPLALVAVRDAMGIDDE